MATLRNKRKLAAVSRETPEGSRSSRGQNVVDPELTQDYISQVSEEIEGRVTKKLSKEFSKTVSRILGALSKLDEFLLNPQVQTCSVAVQGTSRNANSENRETHGDRSSDDPYPEVGYFPHHSDQLNRPLLHNVRNMIRIKKRLRLVGIWCQGLRDVWFEVKDTELCPKTQHSQSTPTSKKSNVNSMWSPGVRQKWNKTQIIF